MAANRILEMVFVFFAVALEILQHLLDVPYLNMGMFVPNYYDVKLNRRITKPVGFYILFVISEISGFLLFWKYLIDYKARLAHCRKYKIPMDYGFEIVHMVIMSSGELPIMMILQYFLYPKFGI